MMSEPGAPGAPAVILYRAVAQDDTESGSPQANYMRLKIFTDEGRKYGDIEIPYMNDGIRIENLHARTIKPDGTVAEFSGKPFTKVIAKARGFQIRAATFTLPQVEAGCVLEYFYTISGYESSSWILNEDLFTKEADFSMQPGGDGYFMNQIEWTWQNMPPGASRPYQEKDKTIRFHVTNVPAFTPEELMPPENEVKERVDFSYSHAGRELKVSDFWSSFSKGLGKSLDTEIGKFKDADEDVAAIIQPGDSPEVKLHKIYTRVQQMRNTSYDKEKTVAELKREKEKVPASVQDAWKKGYGSYFELNRVFLAFARAAGFEAYEIWIPSRDAHYQFDASRMQYFDLNTTIILVKLNGKDTFYDPGSLYSPFGSLPWTVTAVSGLQIDQKNPTWVQVPASLPEQSATARHAELLLSESGDLEGTLTVTFTGMEAGRMRRLENDADAADRKKFLEDNLKDMVAAPCEVNLTNLPNWKSSETPLVAEFHLRVPGWATMAGHHVLVPMGLLGAEEKHRFDHAERVYPIYIAYPFAETDDIEIKAPDGWKVANLPIGWTDTGKVVAYNLAVRKEGDKLKISRSVALNFLLLDPKYYPALRRYFQQIKSTDDEQAVLEIIEPSANK